MLPALLVAVRYLRFEKAPKRAVDGPPQTIASLHPHLNDVFVPRQTVYVEPYTLLGHSLKLLQRMLVLRDFSSSWGSPKPLRAPMRMLAESSSTHGELGQVVFVVS